MRAVCSKARFLRNVCDDVIFYFQAVVILDRVFRGVFGLKEIASTLKQPVGLLIRPIGYILPFCFVCVER